MAEIASQARVGKQGGGEAVVFDTSKFFQNVYTMQKDLYERQEKKKQEIKKQNATWNALLDDMPDVWQSDYEYVNKALNEYNDYIIDLKTQGVDPSDLDPMVMRKIKELQNKVAKEASRAKDNETVSNQYFKILNDDKTNKYNKEYAAKWLKDYGDPKKTPEERAKMRIESNPFKLNYDINEFVKETMPEDSLKDEGRTEVRYVDKEAHKAVIFENITQTETGAEIYESLKKPNETPDQFAERMAELGQKLKPPQTKVDPAPKNSSSAGSQTTKNKKPTVKVKSKDSETKTDSGEPQYDQDIEFNKILLDNTPSVYVVDNEGKRITDFVPSGGFKIRKDGNIDVIGEGKSEADNSVVEITINYERNKDQFNVKGYPNMYNEFRKQGGASAGKSTGGTGGTTLAERMRQNK
jgi:hypothetical protein